MALWSGACSGTGSCSVTMDASKAVTATFNVLPPLTFSLSVSNGGTGSGTVTSSSAGISCGSDCSETYTAGTTVTLTAAAASDSTFAGWSGASTTCTLTMDASKSVTATFNLQTYTLSVSKGGTGSGTVTSSPAGISCGSDCSETYTAGTTVTLTAAAASDSTFAGWSGACSGTGSCSVTMDANKSVTATFTGAGTTPGVFINPQQSRIIDTKIIALNAAPASAALGSWTVDVSYDPAVVAATGCTSTASLLCRADFRPNTVRIGGAAVPGLTGTVTLANLTFRAVGPRGSSTPLTVTFDDPTGVAMPAIATSGAISVGIAYDVNGDGNVTSTDALCVLRKVGEYPATSACPDAADWDPNGDGQISSTDALCILRRGGEYPATGACPSDPPLSPFRLASDVRPALRKTAAGATGVGAGVDPASTILQPGAETQFALTAVAPSAGLGSWTIDVRYDPAVVSAVACASTTSLLCRPDFRSDTVRVGGAAVPGLAGTAALAQITFKGVGPSGAATAIRVAIVTFDNPDGSPIAGPSTANGFIAIGNRDLAFTVSPSKAGQGFPFGIQPTIAVQFGGSTVIADNGTQITLRIVPGTGAPGARLLCSSDEDPNSIEIQKTVTAGLGSFGGCSIDLVGSGYRLEATGPATSTIQSPPFFVVWASDADANCAVDIVDSDVWT